MWQWWNYVLSEVPNGKAVLRVNLDETSICLFQGAGKGAVFVQKRRPRGPGEPAPPAEPVQNVPQAKRRCCLTHIALICDRHDLQPLLPQIIVGNERTLPAGAFAALQASCPANVRLVRQTSAWNNAELCGKVVQWLAEALGARLGELQPVLLLDACKLHFSHEVLQACATHGVWPILIPAKSTWLLQPLDTHAFLKYKAYLRGRYQQARIAHARGDLTIEQFLPCVCDAVRCVLECRKWVAAFEQKRVREEPSLPEPVGEGADRRRRPCGGACDAAYVGAVASVLPPANEGARSSLVAAAATAGAEGFAQGVGRRGC